MLIGVTHTGSGLGELRVGAPTQRVLARATLVIARAANAVIRPLEIVRLLAGALGHPTREIHSSFPPRGRGVRA